MSSVVGYPLIDLRRESAPPRSTLYPRVPRGAGTVLVEGLASYVMGLAEQHNLPTGILVGRVLGPAIGRERGTTIDAADLLRQGTAAIGVGAEAQSWVAVIRAMTGVDATPLTILPWAPVVPPTHVVSAIVRHCPECLCDFGTAAPYEPLIWGLQLVTACPVHRRQLEEACPACGETQRPLTYRSLSALCRACGAWLGQPRPARPASAWQRWTSFALADLASRPVEDASQHALVAALHEAVAALGVGAAGLARAARVTKSGLSSWLAGKRRPSIEATLRICAAGGWSLRDFLCGTLAPLERRFDEFPVPPSPWSQRRARDWSQIRQQVRERLDAPAEPVTFAAIARELNLDRKTLRERERDLAREAVGLRSTWTATRALDRRERAVASVISITRQLHSAGVAPSRRRVEAMLDRPLTLQESELRNAWRQTLSELRLLR